MPTPEALLKEFEEVWENQVTEEGRGAWTEHYAVRLLAEILKELRDHRPVVLEPVEREGVIITRYMGQTDTAQGTRLDLAKFVAVDELNVTPEVAEYARRILMGCRPEPDMGVIQTLLGYTGQRIHPAALELARRILAGEGPTVEVYRKVIRLRQQLFEPLSDVAKEYPVKCEAAEDVDLAPPRTVLVVGPDVDLEPDDPGEDTDG